jgi:hypothetical protein
MDPIENSRNPFFKAGDRHLKGADKRREGTNSRRARSKVPQRRSQWLGSRLRRAAVRRVDSVLDLNHPRTVLRLITRLVAALSVLACAAGGWAPCAGWQPTAEARRACCAQKGQCPMHRSAGAAATRDAVVSQIEADGCCASSERETSAPSTASHVVSCPLAVVASAIPALAPSLLTFRTLRPEPSLSGVNAVPTHLLLSVFLI